MSDFIPAARFHFLTPLYDFFIRLFFDKHFSEIVEKIKASGSEAIIDIGCGPGNMLIALQKKFQNAKIIGLDIDPRILRITEKKIRKAGLSIKLAEASATSIPFEDSSFDVAVSTLVIHHLKTEDKKTMLRETFRILKPNGTFYLFDFAPPKTTLGKIAAKIYRYFEEVDDGVHGKYYEFLKEAGFRNLQALYHPRIFSLEFELIESTK